MFQTRATVCHNVMWRRRGWINGKHDGIYHFDIAKEDSRVVCLEKKMNIENKQMVKANGNEVTSHSSDKGALTNDEKKIDTNAGENNLDDKSFHRNCVTSTSSRLIPEPSRNVMFRHPRIRRSKKSENCVHSSSLPLDLPSPNFRASMKVALNSLFDSNKRCVVSHKLSRIGTVTGTATDVSYSVCSTAEVNAVATIENSRILKCRRFSVDEEFQDKTLAGFTHEHNESTLVSSPQNKPYSHFYYEGLKVIIIDWFYKIFVVDMVRNEVCDLIRHYADVHVNYLDTIGRADLSWRTLYTYTKMDIPCCEVPGVMQVVDEILAKVKSVIGHVFSRPLAASAMIPRSWKEPHLLLYRKIPNMTEHLGVESHHDGSDFTWQLMLSQNNEYDGGGTYFRCLKQTIKLRKGQVLIHPGDLYHSGVNITRGIRLLVVCFMDGFNSHIKDGSSENDDSEEYHTCVAQL